MLPVLIISWLQSRGLNRWLDWKVAELRWKVTQCTYTCCNSEIHSAAASAGSKTAAEQTSALRPGYNGTHPTETPFLSNGTNQCCYGSHQYGVLVMYLLNQRRIHFTGGWAKVVTRVGNSKLLHFTFQTGASQCPYSPPTVTNGDINPTVLLVPVSELANLSLRHFNWNLCDGSGLVLRINRELSVWQCLPL